MPSSRAQCTVILTYHSIAEGASPLKIPPLLFAEQMAWLAANAKVISLRDFLSQGSRPAGERCVVLTFDDGYADFHQHAAPVLLRLQLPATVFLPTGYVGRSNAWPGQPAWVKEEPLLDWKQVKELAEAGVPFESHTVSHPDLCAVDASTLARELAESAREIESHTGRKVEHFCYPYGRLNAAVREAVAQHYKGACSTVAGLAAAGFDPFVLPRVDAHYVRSPRWFRAMFTRQFRAYVETRRLVRKVRGQPEGGYSP